jgi:hypothetical protein
MDVSSQRYSPAVLSSAKEAQVPIGQEAGWVSELVWTLWRRKNLLTLPGIETPPSSPQPVFIPSEMSFVTNTQNN